MREIKGGTGVEIATLAIAAVGAAVAAYGAYSAAQAQQQQLKQVAKQKEQDAEQARMAGEEAANRQRANDKRRLESFGAIAGARGVEAREGSSLMSELDFASKSELEAEHVQYGYKLDERQKRIESTNAAWQASRISPESAATMSLLSSAGSIAGSYATAGAGGGGATQASYTKSYFDSYSASGRPFTPGVSAGD